MKQSKKPHNSQPINETHDFHFFCKKTWLILGGDHIADRTKWQKMANHNFFQMARQWNIRWLFSKCSKWPKTPVLVPYFPNFQDLFFAHPWAERPQKCIFYNNAHPWWENENWTFWKKFEKTGEKKTDFWFYRNRHAFCLIKKC